MAPIIFAGMFSTLGTTLPGFSRHKVNLFYQVKWCCSTKNQCVVAVGAAGATSKAWVSSGLVPTTPRGLAQSRGSITVCCSPGIPLVWFWNLKFCSSLPCPTSTAPTSIGICSLWVLEFSNPPHCFWADWSCPGCAVTSQGWAGSSDPDSSPEWVMWRLSQTHTMPQFPLLSKGI